MAWKQRLEIVREITTILGLIVVPLLIARESGNIQSRIAEQNIGIAEQSINKEYVQLALGILESPERKDDNDNKKLREWSLDLINKFAPIPLPQEAVAQGLPYPGGRYWLGGLAARMPESYSSSSCSEYFIITKDKEGHEKCLAGLRTQEEIRRRDREDELTWAQEMDEMEKKLRELQK